MSQFPYLLRSPHGRLVAQVEALRVGHPEIFEFRTGSHGIRAGHSTGKRKMKKLYIRSQGETKDGSGKWSTIKNHVMEVDRTAAALKPVVRRLREQEAAELDAIDTEITALEEQMAAVRERRKAVLAKAWTRAHVVRLAEVEALVPEDHK